MSQHTAIVLSTVQCPPDKLAFITGMLDVCEAEQVCLVGRAAENASDWKQAASFGDYEVDWEYLDIDKPTAADISSFFVKDARISFSVDKSPLLDRIAEAVNDVDPDVNRDFWVSSLIVRIGSHDIFDQTSEEGEYLYNAYTSVHIWGYGIPVNMDLARTVFLALPEVQALAEKLSPLFGEVRLAVICET